MLALPTVTAAAGFQAASIAMLASWAYTLLTGILVAEVSCERKASILFRRGKIRINVIMKFEAYSKQQAPH
jgi:hypothetical protein